MKLDITTFQVLPYFIKNLIPLQGKSKILHHVEIAIQISVKHHFRALLPRLNLNNDYVGSYIKAQPSSTLMFNPFFCPKCDSSNLKQNPTPIQASAAVTFASHIRLIFIYRIFFFCWRLHINQRHDEIIFYVDFNMVSEPILMRCWANSATHNWIPFLLFPHLRYSVLSIRSCDRDPTTTKGNNCCYK